MLLLSHLLLVGTSSTWWVTSSSEKVALRASRPPRAETSAVLSAQRGEIESFQLHVVLAAAAATGAPALSWRGAAPAVQHDWRKVVHVWCNRSAIYPAGSSDGWQPDGLLDESYFGAAGTVRVPLEAAVVHTFWVRLKVGRAAAPGTYAAQLLLPLGDGIRVPVELKVWPLALPPLEASFGTIAAPPFGNVSAGASFTIELALGAVAKRGPVLDCRDARTGHGVHIDSAGGALDLVLNLTFCDTAGRCQSWDTDVEAGLGAAGPVAHHAVFIVDGRSRTIQTVSNGKWADGGSQRAAGFTHIGGGMAGDGGIGLVDGAARCAVGSAASLVRAYPRALLVSEAISNWRVAARGRGA